MSSVIAVSPSEAEVTPRIIEGRQSLLMSPYQAKTAERILEEPQNEIQWNGQIYGYRLVTKERGSTDYWYQFELYYRRGCAV